jgi:hypothetical protein
MLETKDIIETMSNNIPWVWIASIGWFVHYLYKVTKWEKFSVLRLIINIILAWWIGFLCQEAWLAPAYISIAWFCTYPLLNLIENKFPDIIATLLKK